MGKGLCKRGAALCAGMMILASSCARAEFSPRYGDLLTEPAVVLEIGGRIEQKEGMADASLSAVNDWLSGMTAEITLNADGTAYRVEAFMRDERLLAVTCCPVEEGMAAVFEPVGHVYLTSPGQPDALSLMTGRTDSLPDPLRWARAYRQAAPDLFRVLAQGEEIKQIQEKTSIQYALSPPVYEAYVFRDGALNELWPQALEILLPALRQALSDQPEALEGAEAWLTAAAFSGESRIRRFLDQDGGDMGFQFSGRAGLLDDPRKISLMMGFTPGRGGSVTLSMPAVSGKDTLKLSLGGRLTEKDGDRTLTLSGAYTRKDGDVNRSAEIEGTLKNAIRNGGEAWSGKFTVMLTEGKSKTVWTVTPALTFTDVGLQGEVTLQKKNGSKAVLKAVLTVRMTRSEPVDAPESGEKKDLRGMDAAQARVLVMGELSYLTALTARMFSGLPEDVRTRLTHDLRTESWMTGPSVSVPGQTHGLMNDTQEDVWVVVEEEDAP